MTEEQIQAKMDEIDESRDIRLVEADDAVRLATYLSDLRAEAIQELENI